MSVVVVVDSVEECSMLADRLHKNKIYILPHMIIIVIWITFESAWQAAARSVLLLWLNVATLQRLVKFRTKYRRSIRLVIRLGERRKTRTQTSTNVNFTFVETDGYREREREKDKTTFFRRNTDPTHVWLQQTKNARSLRKKQKHLQKRKSKMCRR